MLGPATENLHPLQRQRAVLGSQRGNFSSFELFHSWCVAFMSFMFEWSVLGQWVHVFLLFAFNSHISVNLVIGISSMRLNEGSKEISSQIVAKSL